jgi:hypothetical protein
MVVEPHAPEAGPLGRGGAGQGVVDADTERLEEQVDLHEASMAEPTGWTDPARPSDWWHPADPPSEHHPGVTSGRFVWAVRG